MLTPKSSGKELSSSLDRSNSPNRTRTGRPLEGGLPLPLREIILSEYVQFGDDAMSCSHNVKIANQGTAAIPLNVAVSCGVAQNCLFRVGKINLISKFVY